jgi:hypothetical protein
MKLEFVYVCNCGLTWSSIVATKGLGFIDTTCKCPSCSEEQEAVETRVV